LQLQVKTHFNEFPRYHRPCRRKYFALSWTWMNQKFYCRNKRFIKNAKKYNY
jgi:hypothetical protein